LWSGHNGRTVGSVLSPALAPPHATRHEVADLVASMGAELDALSAVLAEAIHTHLDELPPDLRALTLQSCRANLGLIVTLLRDEADPRGATVPSEALSYANSQSLK
jgi:hypothetical protein